MKRSYILPLVKKLIHLDLNLVNIKSLLISDEILIQESKISDNPTSLEEAYDNPVIYESITKLLEWAQQNNVKIVVCTSGSINVSNWPVIRDFFFERVAYLDMNASLICGVHCLHSYALLYEDMHGEIPLIIDFYKNTGRLIN